jgi:hypothetical protein
MGTDMKSILDPSFRYTRSVETDLRKTFARIDASCGSSSKPVPYDQRATDTARYDASCEDRALTRFRMQIWRYDGGHHGVI